jgi:hypothetical protein
MIQMSELRIGNMVRDNKGRILPVLWIHREGICLEEMEDFIDGNEFVSDQQVNVPFFTAQENVFGVPLTIDILKRCGFEPALENPSPGYGPMDYTLTYDDTEHHREYMTVWHEDDGRWFLNEFGYIPLEYLHQLQNITYCLRGKELEVNL